MRPPEHPPGYNNRKKDTYEIRVTCWNCDEVVDCDVPKGTLATDYLKNQMCPNCECKGTFLEDVEEA